MRVLNLTRPGDAGQIALERWTAARRILDHDQTGRALLAEMRRLRGEVLALRLALEGKAA